METVGRYQLKGIIGEGGMATVYRAFDPLIKREVAVKILSREFSADSVLRQRFQVEAETVAALEHEAIVPIYDFGESEAQLYLVMRLMQGGSLEEKLENAPLPVSQAIQVIRRLAAALDAVHAKGIVHRDLKPANILYDQHGRPYLSDFGIVKLLEGSASLTGSGFIGTPAYLCPEQVTQAADIDHRSDVYAMGVMLYEMLTGKRPYDPAAFVVLVLEREPVPIPSVREINPDLPEGCDRIIAKAMAISPAERYNTAGEMAAELSFVLSEHTEIPEESGYLSAKKRNIRPAFAWGLISLLIISTVALGLLLSSLVNPDSSTSTTGTTGPGFQPEVAPETDGSATTPVLLAAPSATRPAPFGEEQLGVLLLIDSGNASQDDDGSFAPLLRGDLQALLVETGLVDQVGIQIWPIKSGETLSLSGEVEGQSAGLGIMISVGQDAGAYTLIADGYLGSGFQPAENQIISSTMKITTDAMLAPFIASSQADASQVLANRIAAILNTTLGVSAMHEGAYDTCARRFTAVIDLLEEVELAFNRGEASHASLALCLDGLGQNEEAREHYALALEINPDYSLAYYGLGNYHFNQGDIDQAEQFYKETISRSFSDPVASDEILSRAYVGLGNVAIARGDYELALEPLNKAVLLKPDYPGYFLSRAITNRALGRESAAQEDLEACLDLSINSEPQLLDYYRQLEVECRRLLKDEASVITATVPIIMPTATLGLPPLPQSLVTEAIVKASSASLRSGPGPDYPILFILIEGDRVSIIARNNQGDWYNVLLADGSRGWIYGSALEMAGGFTPEDIPVAATIPAQSAIKITPSIEVPPPAESGATDSGSSEQPAETASTRPPTIPPPPPTAPPPTSPPPVPTAPPPVPTAPPG